MWPVGVPSDLLFGSSCLLALLELPEWRRHVWRSKSFIQYNKHPASDAAYSSWSASRGQQLQGYVYWL
jgi:hypothetical protein